MNPVLLLLLCSLAAAALAPLGVLPLSLRGDSARSLRWLGWASALAAGIMLGNSLVLAGAALSYPPALGAAGALLGIGVVFATHRISGTEDLDPLRLEDSAPDFGYRILFQSGLHAAFEGVGIGAAMLHSIPLGVWVALSMAVHNVPEAAVVGAVVGAKGVSRSHSILLAVVTNSGQVFVAVTVFAVVQALPGALPAALGFAVGALVFLVLSDLLPQAYAAAGATAIAVVTTIAMGIVALLGGGVL